MMPIGHLSGDSLKEMHRADGHGGGDRSHLLDSVYTSQSFSRAFASDRERTSTSSAHLPELGIVTTADFRPGEEDRDLLHLTGGSSRIASVAEGAEGREMWRSSSKADLTLGGKFGCAASAAEVLQRGGVRVPDAATVGQLDNSLRRRGWSRGSVSERQPGCVVIGHRGGSWKDGGGKAHIGIVGTDRNSICNNKSRDGGVWTCEPLASAIPYPNRYSLCPPRH